jgi:alkanesulfonate monooxygenase SsuD/methylene tetrahydromethanopterin reductase-like flavin-dependent oxidoreductase (luciferase family)
MFSTNIVRGARGLSQPLVDDIENYWSPAYKVQAMGHARSLITGSPDTVRSGMDAPIAVTGADKIVILSDVYGHATRLQSFIVGAGGVAC